MMNIKSGDLGFWFVGILSVVGWAVCAYWLAVGLWR